MSGGNAVQAQIPGIFDNVFCGTTMNFKQADGTLLVKRCVIIYATGGWQGKVRGDLGKVLPVEETGDVTTILSKMDAKP